MARTKQAARKSMTAPRRQLASKAARGRVEREGEEDDQRARPKKHSWPFGCEGEPTDVLVPPGKTLPKINKLLEKAEVDAGEFSFGGQADALPALPGLTVEGVGTIQLPFSPEKLLPVCEQDGGKESSTWRLGPDRVTFKNPLWLEGMQTLTTTVGDRLGFKGVKLACELQELVVYGEGAVVNKTQNEKKSGVVATLVIQLPSEHAGGALVVYRGRDLEFRHDFGVGNGTAPFVPQYAVYFADAPHSREEVTSGCQLMLKYSLVLPPEMMHLQDAKGEKRLSEELAEMLRDIEPNEECFVMLLKNSYDEASLRQRGIDALRGVDKARYRALLEASNLVPESKALTFYVVHVSRANQYYDINPFSKKDEDYTGEYGEWEDYDEVDTVKWYSAVGKKYADTVTKYKPSIERGGFGTILTPAFLNPDRLKLSQVWKEYNNVVFEHDEDEMLKIEVGRFAVFAWPEKKDVDYALDTIGMDAAADALRRLKSVDATTLREFMEKSSPKESEDEEDYDVWSCRHQKAQSYSLGFCNTLIRLIINSCDPVLVILFFSEFFDALETKNEFVGDVVEVIRAFPWSDVGDAILKALAPAEQKESSYSYLRAEKKDHKLNLTLRVIDGLENGEALQALLADAIKRSTALTTKVFLSSGCLDLLWKVVIAYGDTTLLSTVVTYFKQLEPRDLGPIIVAASKCVAGLDVQDERFVGVSVLAETRLGWLNQQLSKPEQPFTWEMPGAQFNGSARVQNFLRGPQQTMTLSGFSSIRSARSFAYYSQNPASFVMSAGGSGRSSYVTITKTRQYYEQSQKRTLHLAAEREKLLSERFTAPAPTNDAPTVGQKRPREEPEVIVID